MYSGTDSCSSCGGCEKRDKDTDSYRGCNQSINQSINQDPVYTGKYCLHGSGQSFERANCLPIQPIYAEPCKFCYSTACKQVRTNFCQSQLWTGFLIKDAELGSTLLTRKLSKKFHGRTDRTGQNFRPTVDQVKNLHGLYGPSCVFEMRIRARFCPFNNLSGPVKLHVRYWKKKEKKMSVSKFLKIVY